MSLKVPKHRMKDCYQLLGMRKLDKHCRQTLAYMLRKGGEFNEFYETAARHLHTDEQTLYESIKCLEAFGYIEQFTDENERSIFKVSRSVLDVLPSAPPF